MPQDTDRSDASILRGECQKGGASAERSSQGGNSGWQKLNGRSVHYHKQASSSEAELMPDRPFNPFAAFMPAGVAAFPRPRRFADTFDESASMVSLSLAAEGKSLIRTGSASARAFQTVPSAALAPLHRTKRQIIPQSDRQSVMASLAPLMAAGVRDVRLPFKAPKTREKTTMSTIKRFNNIIVHLRIM